MFSRIFLSNLLAAFLVVVYLVSGSAGRAMAAGDGLNAAQKTEVEKLVEEYIVNNPEILIRAIRQYTARQQATERDRAKNNLVSLAAELNQNPGSPVVGNPDGDITIVEFFDYRCGFCKKVFPTIQTLLGEDRNIRYVMKEFPILGPVSVKAAQAALAVWYDAPDKYMAFHAALMSSRGRLSEERIFSIAAGLGLDVEAIRRGMLKEKVIDEINGNMELANRLGINGTPAFVIGDELAPGAIDMDEFKRLVALARKG